MKLHVEVDGKSRVLETRVNGALTEYVLDGAAGSASIEEVRPGVFSVLIGASGYLVNVAAHGEMLEVVSKDGRSHQIAVADPRDRRGASDAGASKGPVIIRAQMPGKIIKLLVMLDESVEAGQGLMVVEAMKMQNEVKAPKNGVVKKILTSAGETVAAGDTLIVVE